MAKRFVGSIPDCGPLEDPDLELQKKAEEVYETYVREMAQNGFHKALTSVWEMIGLTNRYIDRTEPFRLAKEPEKQERLGAILYHLLEVNRLMSVFLWPFMPETAEKMAAQLGADVPGARGDLEKYGKWGGLKAGVKIKKPKALFPRVDLDEAGLTAKSADAKTEKTEARKEKGTGRKGRDHL